MNLSDHLRKLPMQCLFGDGFFRAGMAVRSVWVVLVCFEVSVLPYLGFFFGFIFCICWGFFLGGWSFLDKKQYLEKSKERVVRSLVSAV